MSEAVEPVPFVLWLCFAFVLGIVMAGMERGLKIGWWVHWTGLLSPLVPQGWCVQELGGGLGWGHAG